MDPPGFLNTVYYEWPDQSFTSNQERTFTQTYSFLEDGEYHITAEIYDVSGKDFGWLILNRFDSHSESFTVGGGATYDADAEEISLSPSSVSAGQPATISAQFQNLSLAGAGTFDLRLAVDPPGFLNTVYYEWLDQPFTRDQQRTFTQNYTFSQAGDYEITAEILNINGKTSNWSSSNRFDSHSVSFTEQGSTTITTSFGILPGGLTMDDIPEGWHGEAKLIYAALEESSFGVGKWDIPDVRVYVGIEPAGAAIRSSESEKKVLRIRLEHDAAAVVKELSARAAEMVELIDDLLMQIGITDQDKIDQILKPIMHQSLVFILENVGIKDTLFKFEYTDWWGSKHTIEGVDIAESIAIALTEVFILGTKAQGYAVDFALATLEAD